MKLVNEISDGPLTLTHRIMADEWGILRDVLTIARMENNRLVHYPFFPPIKVNDYNPDSSIHDQTNKYTVAEYLWMLDSMKNKLPPL